MNKIEKAFLIVAMLSKAFVNRHKQSQKPEGSYKGVAFINFWHLVPNTHHGTLAFLLEPEVRPEDYRLWGPFGYSEDTSIRIRGRDFFLYAMDWGIPGSEHFADSEELRKIAEENPNKKILLVGVRSLNGKLWFVYGEPENFLLVHK